MERNVLVAILGFLFIFVLIITLSGGQDILIIGGESESPNSTTINYSDTGRIDAILDTFNNNSVITTINYNNASLISFILINDSGSLNNITLIYNNDSLLSGVQYG